MLVKLLSLILCLLFVSSAASAGSDVCEDYTPMRRAYFGDLHVHTSYSQDARLQDTRTTPADAYRYARGEAIEIPPYIDGRETRTVSIDRPLDFAAVTDHAEFLGENRICTTPGEKGYWSLTCVGWRLFSLPTLMLLSRAQTNGERLGFCGDDAGLCLSASRTIWQETQSAANEADASGGCEFTAFIGYEWTGAIYPQGARLISNLHRNVIFANERVPDLPRSALEDRNDALSLYRSLEASCRSGDTGCDAVSIPHNSNISLGYMFSDTNLDGSAMSAEDARLRASYETLAEIIQHKGASECYYGTDPLMPRDELCSFEQLPWNSFVGNTFAYFAEPLQADAGFLRESLHKGLRTEQRLGENPFKFGFIGSTDTHLSMAGGVAEGDFSGHGGAGNAAEEESVEGLPDEWEFNPGGLAVLYAEENSRQSLFAAMKRKEAYATSGPRIQLRFFAGDGIAENACSRADMVEAGYAGGVPMGGSMGGLSQSPAFLVSAAMDATGGDRLQRVQIIKGWLDKAGVSRERVYDVAGNVGGTDAIDPDSCKSTPGGFEQLCTVWVDPEFRTEQKAFYYARVLENPSCRWSARICNVQQVNCSDPDSLSDETSVCCASEVPRIVQERAWSSPIWYQPTD